MIRKAFFIFLFFSYSLVSAQESANFTQFYMNPYRINPAYAGIEGRGAMFLTYRKQWVGIEGAPTIINFSYHNTSKSNANFGININNDAIGIRNSTSLMITLGYTLPVSKDQYIRFGISGGMAMNTYDLDLLGDAVITDPDLEGLLQNSFNVVGDFGLSYHNKFFSIGASLPNLFSTSYDSLSSFGLGNFSATEKMIFNTSYRYYFGFEDRFAIEPHAVYRLRGALPSQYEAALIFHLNNTLWIGGSYKQNYGISGTGGIKINALFALGYAYGIAGPDIDAPTHEFQINLNFRKKHRNKQVNSFTDSKKPIVKKNRRQLLAEQHKAERERIIAERVAAAKAAAEKAEQDRLAAEKAEAERIAQQQREEQQKQQTEVERIAQEQREEAQRQQQAEADRIAQQQREEAQRQQQSETANIAQQQREEAQRRQQAEAERIAQEQREEAQRQQQAEADRIAQKQKAEADRLAQQQEELLRQAQQEVTIEQETKIDDRGNAESAFTTDEKVSVKRGGHFLELKPGEYVVIGVFSEFEHAELFSDNLFERGYKTRFGYISETKMWYVHLYESEDGDIARSERDKYRKLNLFKSAWVLSVEQ